jgi:hypothetical protein
MELDNSGLFPGQGIYRPKALATLNEYASPKDPAQMDTAEFLCWLDEASEDELRAFSSRGSELDDPETYYDVLTRTYINTRTGAI